MVNSERVKIWQERLAQWRASGLSQRAFALKHDIPFRQVGYWARRLSGGQMALAPALMPVRVVPAPAPAAPLSLRSEHGWTLTLPRDVPASWLAELMRAL
ncbi:IS66 family insertion sequence element accessory protein TnpA [Janthinobacterium svalbardensis]|uniref:IS66 family insertion sequence element accessory protein TnpA n=1 Tax=Janthinobacterium svalbardensis TaxID=368607 RepID=UPI003CC59F51